jgi:hypothetical protein
MNNLRNKLWQLIVGHYSEGTILPTHILAIRVLLYPLDSFYWYMSNDRGYDWKTDTWNICGLKVSSGTIKKLGDAQGEVYQQ